MDIQPKSTVRQEMECAFSVLGPMAVRINGRVCTPTASKVRQVLALLLLRANQVVGLDAAMEELWGDQPPRTAVTIIQTYVYQLRKLLAEHSRTQVIHTVAPGYVLDVPADSVDFWRFTRQVDQARQDLDRGAARPAASRLTAALELWTGPVLDNVEHGPLLTGYVARLEEQRMLARELRLRANMNLGRHRELIPELKSLVAAHPFHEWLHAQLMIALHRSGRRGEALTAYQDVRRLLSAELGVEPSATLKRIQQSVLSGESAKV
jgi:SARP family transcriptional regulator, regulator of embCAB operon